MKPFEFYFEAMYALFSRIYPFGSEVNIALLPNVTNGYMSKMGPKESETNYRSYSIQLQTVSQKSWPTRAKSFICVDTND